MVLHVTPFSPARRPSVVSASSYDSFDVESPLMGNRKIISSDASWLTGENHEDDANDHDHRDSSSCRRRSRASVMGLDLSFREDDDEIDERDDPDDDDEYREDCYSSPRRTSRKGSIHRQSSLTKLTTTIAAAPAAAAAVVQRRRSSNLSTSSNPKDSSFSSSTSFTFTSNKSLGIMVLLSWLTCWVTNFGGGVTQKDSDLSSLVPPSASAWDTLDHLSRLDQHRDLHVQHYRQQLAAVTEQNRNAQDTLQFLNARHELLHHEVRVFEELKEQGVHMNPLDRDPARNTNVMVSDWLRHRQEGLERRVQALQQRVQETDRMALIDQYGPGPRYRVQFNVQASGPHSKEDSFVVELASNQHMPHTVLYFLNWVTAKAWDNTAFLHHERLEHVMAAVPVDFDSKEDRPLDHRMAFPEYSDHYPHSKYTLGMGKLGPAFYVNIQNNVRWHGPGGHKRQTVFSLEGDPCFGKIVEGIEAVDWLISYGFSLAKSKPNQPKAKDDPEAWSRIVSIKLLK